MYKQTLAFIRRKDELLMLNRAYAPTLGLWNGVGGKLEDGETVIECIVREIGEETGIKVESGQVQDKDIVSWEVDGLFNGGMHVYLVDINDDYTYSTPRKTEEGILDWKEISWLLAEKNYGVGELIPKFLPRLLGEESNYHHRCIIQEQKLIRYTYEKLVHL